MRAPVIKDLLFWVRLSLFSFGINRPKGGFSPNIPAMIWGPPGEGKTARLEQLAAQYGLRFRGLVLSTLDAAEIHGLRAISGELDSPVTAPAMPEWLKTLGQGPGVLFLDELTTARPAQQAAGLRIVRDRVVAEKWRLPETVAVLAAGNPPDQGAGAGLLEPAMANRFAHFQYSLSGEEYCEYLAGLSGDGEEEDVLELALQGGDSVLELGALQQSPRIPGAILQWRKAWRKELPRVARQIAGFLRAKPDLRRERLDNLLDEQKSGPWASPRTWEYAAILLAGVKTAPFKCADEGADFIALASCVGPEAAQAFKLWLEEALPEPEELLDNPEVWPSREDRQYAATEALTSWLSDRLKSLDSSSDEALELAVKLLKLAVFFKREKKDGERGARLLHLARSLKTGDGRSFSVLLVKAGRKEGISIAKEFAKEARIGQRT